eukprot:Gregarina_sp_Poly_1__839@NODE_11_length_23386_cov_122_075861_g9_i0_p6_GENE_NODE_11_length_23386_cov_122_075861_g9_i0NODE_11_length_23386_cov_122_075861_g9_i0_p6_ORF_typecomplete_len391_score42_81HATPase_c_3/PF13589_6/6_9e24DNA_mis_repair/PF01119_19/7e08HATPase_c/PF02518_26/3_7e08DUF3880/PF12996_7/0_094HATPase_c_2/PF13581_6/0_35_NODE_11_length_23386_cov_122_075861_g9_i063367508
MARQVTKLSKSDRRRIESEQAIFDHCSIIKEVVENAIDAHATHIDITLVENGFKSIKVRDDGIGMNREVLENSLRPHTTTKITSFQDLDTRTISSLGFRGEALSAISNLSSSVTIITKQENDAVGLKLTAEGDDIGSVIETSVSFSSGSVVEISEPFWRSPRLDILKTRKQLSAMIALLQEFAIVHSNGIAFRVYHLLGDNVFDVFQTPGNVEDPRSLIAGFFNLKDLNRNLIKVSVEGESWRLNGLVVHPSRPILVRRSTQRLGYQATQKQQFLMEDTQQEGGKKGRSISKGRICIFAINKRPTNFPVSLQRSIDSIYRQHTTHNCACAFLHIFTTDPSVIVDFNVSSDKRSFVLPILTDVTISLTVKLCISECSSTLVRENCNACLNS